MGDTCDILTLRLRSSGIPQVLTKFVNLSPASRSEVLMP
jgi:hypothetical protein